MFDINVNGRAPIEAAAQPTKQTTRTRTPGPGRATSPEEHLVIQVGAVLDMKRINTSMIAQDLAKLLPDVQLNLMDVIIELLTTYSYRHRDGVYGENNPMNMAWEQADRMIAALEEESSPRGGSGGLGGRGHGGAGS